MLVFSTPLLKYCSSNLLTGSPLPPPPLPRSMYLYVQCDRRGEGIGLCGDHTVYKSYTLCIWPDSEPTKLLYRPKQKPWRGGGLRQISTCHQVHLQVNFKKSGHLGLESISYFVLDSISTALTTRRALPEHYRIKDCTRCQDLNPPVDHWLRSRSTGRWHSRNLEFPVSLSGGAGTENTEC